MLTCVAIWALCLQSYSHAFVVTTNIQNAIQYMKQTIYTTSWGQQWTTQVAVNTWAAGWVIYMQTAAWTPLVCDSTGNWCKSISSLVTGNMTNGTIPMATNTTSLANSLLRQVGPKVIVDWTLSTVWNLEVKNGKVSALSYCDATETNCRSGNDLYTKAQIDNLLAFSYYSTWNTYSKNYIDANLVQTWTLLNNYHTRTYIDGMFYPRTYIDWNLVTSWFLTTNYYTRGYIDANTYTQTHIQGNYLTSGQIMNGFSSVMSFLTWNYYDRTTIDWFLQNNITWSIASGYIPVSTAQNTLTNSKLFEQWGKLWYNTTNMQADFHHVWTMIAGSLNNAIRTATNSVIIWWQSNIISWTLANSVIVGWEQNIVTAPNAFAWGYQTQAVHTWSFVRSDSAWWAPLTSSQSNQLSMRARWWIRFDAGTNAVRIDADLWMQLLAVPTDPILCQPWSIVYVSDWTNWWFRGCREIAWTPTRVDLH